MQKYNVYGMTCSACAARVQNAVSAVDGVDECNVNLLTNTMTVTGNADNKQILKAVQKAGYKAKISTGDEILPTEENENIKRMIIRLMLSVILLLPLMYISMGYTMWGWRLPEFLQGFVAFSMSQAILSLIILIINSKFFISGIKGVLHKSANMDTLVALGSGASYVYSLAMFIDALANNHSHMPHYYFESAAMIVTLITVGKTLEAYAKGKTTSSIKQLLSLTPKTANIIVDGKEISIDANKVKTNDIFVVRAGESIAVDGVIIDGNGAVNEAMLTGESVPVDKSQGDKVACATILEAGFIKCRATNVGNDTALAKIIKMVADASSSKAPIAKLADKVSAVFVPVVIIIAIITFIVWQLIQGDFAFSLNRAVSVLVISCPCALGLATPVAIMVGSGKGAKNGILFKNAEALEQTGKTQIAVFDKTGTVTLGKPEVTDVLPISCSMSQLLEIAYSLEYQSRHPLAKAVVEYAKKEETELVECRNFSSVTGSGISAEFENETVYSGNERFISGICNIPNDCKIEIDKFANEGKTPIIFAKKDCILGIFAIADKIKSDSKKAVSLLKQAGIYTVLLTGDNEKTASAVAGQLGFDKVISQALPETKEYAVSLLSKQGKTIMVGDGINDAPALVRADIGIAVGSGTDVAVESADVVIASSSLCDVVKAVNLSRLTLANIKQNLFWAFIYNAIGIPLAAGVLYGATGYTITPMFAAFAMSLSSFCVITNALRLNLLDISKTKKLKKINDFEINLDEITERNDNMEIILKIEGMMCPHCEASVKKALEAVDGVVLATPSHTENNAVVKLSKDVDVALLEKAVEDAGYTVVR